MIRPIQNQWPRLEAKAEGGIAAITAERDAALESYDVLTKRVLPMVRNAQAQRKELEETKGLLAGLSERLAKVEAQPVPARGRGTPVDRAGRPLASGTGTEVPPRLEVLRKVHDVPAGRERQEALLKAASESRHREKMERERKARH